ncbi:Pvc16 family protein [Moorena producens JHB]|uniref:Pvc16 family protein n=1 Tax=Moorena producens (strain JHB) TaxID=1454205 RepID=A0A9Q9SV27_MOOP1|nr:Pvc16 family protein [Moorena producens]WAN70192.1 Pvc16 family protein [Moorena producens JHB]
MQQNLEFGSSDWLLEHQSNGKLVTKLTPPRVDCSYLITAWPQRDDDIRTEHQLLGEVMKVLLRYRTIPKHFLADKLVEEKMPLRLICLRPSKLQGFGEFRQAIGGKDGNLPKVVLHCTVTIAVVIDEIGVQGTLADFIHPPS